MKGKTMTLGKIKKLGWLMGGLMWAGVPAGMEAVTELPSEEVSFEGHIQQVENSLHEWFAITEDIRRDKEYNRNAVLYFHLMEAKKELQAARGEFFDNNAPQGQSGRLERLEAVVGILEAVIDWPEHHLLALNGWNLQEVERDLDWVQKSLNGVIAPANGNWFDVLDAKLKKAQNTVEGLDGIFELVGRNPFLAAGTPLWREERLGLGRGWRQQLCLKIRELQGRLEEIRECRKKRKSWAMLMSAQPAPVEAQAKQRRSGPLWELKEDVGDFTVQLIIGRGRLGQEREPREVLERRYHELYGRLNNIGRRHPDLAYSLRRNLESAGLRAGFIPEGWVPAIAAQN